MTTATLIRPEHITLERVEGLRLECVGVTVESREDDGDLFAATDVILRAWALSAPEDGSYHKVDFHIVYTDEYVYEGTLDLMYNHVLGINILGEHMWNFLREDIEKGVKDAIEFAGTHRIGH